MLPPPYPDRHTVKAAPGSRRCSTPGKIWGVQHLFFCVESLAFVKDCCLFFACLLSSAPLQHPCMVGGENLFLFSLVRQAHAPSAKISFPVPSAQGAYLHDYRYKNCFLAKGVYICIQGWRFATFPLRITVALVSQSGVRI